MPADWLDVRIGDCRQVLDTLPEASVHCVVTSPPYWGLRDYGTGTWVGGDQRMECPECHGATETPESAARDEACPRCSGMGTIHCDHVQRSNKHGGTSNRPGLEAQTYEYRDTCGKCGATRVDRQLGLEPTPEEYVANMVDVFRKVRRVLRDDGTLWLNLGDSYASDMKGSGGPTPKQASNSGSFYQPIRLQHGLKPKDLVGIPWRVAFALQADGWYLRSDIIWAKPNPMPESVTDRPTKSHEYMFLLSKSPRYFFDQEAVREAQEGDGGRTRQDAEVSAGRNIRTVWTIATKPYPGAHFAVFPPALVEPCVKAGCPEGGVVLDPFAGSGTVGMVANKLSRRAVLIDLNPEYADQIDERTAQGVLGV